MIERIFWNNQWWTTHPRWGLVHDKKIPRANCWYDGSALSISTEGWLSLGIHFNPQSFAIGQTGITYTLKAVVNTADDIPIVTSVEGDKYLTLDKLVIWRCSITGGQITTIDTCKEWFEVPYGVGFICSEDEYGFGLREIECKMPKGVGLWAAFWGMSPTAKVPEDDTVEAYSGTTDYKHKSWPCGKLKHWELQDCIHTDPSFKLNAVPVQTPTLNQFNNNPGDTFNKFGVAWRKESIKYYINDVCIREVTNPGVLKNFADFGDVMVLINNHIDGRYVDKFDVNNQTAFIVKNYKFTPY